LSKVDKIVLEYLKRELKRIYTAYEYYKRLGIDGQVRRLENAAQYHNLATVRDVIEEIYKTGKGPG
jgi:hypothetical protein